MVLWLIIAICFRGLLQACQGRYVLWDCTGHSLDSKATGAVALEAMRAMQRLFGFEGRCASGVNTHVLSDRPDKVLFVIYACRCRGCNMR